jgi:uncharacterized protein YjbJ (UPF0337 family)
MAPDTSVRWLRELLGVTCVCQRTDTAARRAHHHRSQSNCATRKNIMNWEIVEGNWKQFRGTIQARWGKLSDDHLKVISGNRNELRGKLQEAYGLSKQDAEGEIEAFEKRNKKYGAK